MAHRSIPPPSPEDPRESIWADVDAHAGTREALERVRARAVPIVAVVVVLGIGWWLVRPSPPPAESQIPVVGSTTPAGATAAADPTGLTVAGASSTTVAEVVAQAAGAVRQPGVYHFALGSRVDDLVRRAGGLREDADRARINLAAPLIDGQRIWIPVVGEDEIPTVVAGEGGGGAGGGSAASAASGEDGSPSPGASAMPISINSATEVELDELPGIGPATAQAIVAHREEVGRFTSIDDLLDVRGIGDAKLEQLRPLVTL